MTGRRRDFDAVYYMGVHNHIGGKIPLPPVIRALIEKVSVLKPKSKRVTETYYYYSYYATSHA